VSGYDFFMDGNIVRRNPVAAAQSSTRNMCASPQHPAALFEEGGEAW
jgi:hypothetical protein